jgi:hypothetical protein
MSKEYEYLKKFDSDIRRYRKDADMIKKLEKVKKLQFEYDDFEVFDTLISNGKYFPNLETLYIDHYNNDYLSELTIPSVKLLQFKKLKDIWLTNTYFEEEAYFEEVKEGTKTMEMGGKPFMYHMKRLKNLEAISFLALEELYELKDFKKLKQIGELLIGFNDYSDEEFKETTKNIHIDNVANELIRNK